MTKLDIGIVELPAMGRSLALNMVDHGFEVGGYNRSAAVTQQVMGDHPHENLTPFYGLNKLVDTPSRPRKVMLMIQAGKPVGAVTEQLTPFPREEDMILDRGNSFLEDTRRQATLLAEKRVHYLEVGTSGGEESVQLGPSTISGGNVGAYESARPILEAIAAKAMNEPRCSCVGPDRAGHYVKIIRNGIEYVDMQLVAESYLLLKYVGGFANQELGHIFKSRNDRELHSYLIGITAGILRETNDLMDEELINRVKGSAKQKGTGRWASIEALKQGVDIPMITSACTVHIMPNHLGEREKVQELIHSPAISFFPDKGAFAVMVRKALYTGEIIAYAQDFFLMQDASRLYD